MKNLEEANMTRRMLERVLEIEKKQVPSWTPEEAFEHISYTFLHECRLFPDLMEPYLTRYEGADGMGERMAIMRSALRETIARRYLPGVAGSRNGVTIENRVA